MKIRIETLVSMLTNPKECYRAAVCRIEQLKASGEYLTIGGLTPDEERCVADLAAESGDGPEAIVEIGTLFGFTTSAMAAKSKRKIITVDIFCWNPFGWPPKYHRMFTTKILQNAIENGKIEIVVQESAKFRASWNMPPPAMIFLDADHSYEPVRDEIAWAKKIGIPIIAGHDYGDPTFGVTRAVDEAFPQESIHTQGRVWWVKNTGI